MSDTAVCFAPRKAATGKPLKLALQRLWLTGRVLPAGARVIVQHVFRSEESKPLEVIYSFPLPRDAALRSFRITGEGFEAHSELKETEAAVRAYEEGLVGGSLSALARDYGDGIVNLTVGNIRPQETVTVYLEILAGVELRDDGFRFRFPFTLAPGYHPQFRTAITGPGEGEIELPANEFGDINSSSFPPGCVAAAPGWIRSGSEYHARSRRASIALPRHPGRPSSCVARTGEGSPNRDLVLDCRIREVVPQVLSGPVNGKTRFAAIIPSSSFGARSDAARRVVILLDRSGSMAGTPLEQAKRSIEACLGAMSDCDLFASLHSTTGSSISSTGWCRPLSITASALGSS